MSASTATTCTSCRWWKAYTSPDDWEWPDLRDEHGDTIYDENYLTTKAPGTWGECTKAAEFGPSQSDRFYVVDGSEYKAVLNTRGDFGCVEHEPDSGRHREPHPFQPSDDEFCARCRCVPSAEWHNGSSDHA